jgi:hypothetical protein
MRRCRQYSSPSSERYAARNADEIYKRIEGTEMAAMIDRHAAAQRSGVLGSLNIVADAFKLLPKESETERRWSTVEWAEERKGCRSAQSVASRCVLGASIEKGDGRKRPLGIAALEDKIVQHAMVTIFNQIYEEDFLGSWYGLRPGRSTASPTAASCA